MNVQEKAREAKERVEQLGEEVGSRARNLWLAGLGVAGALVEETTDIFESLVAKGRDHEIHLQPKALLDEATRRVDRTVHEVGERAKSTFGDATTGLFEHFGVPTRNEVRSLIERVEKLNAKLTRMASEA